MLRNFSHFIRFAPRNYVRNNTRPCSALSLADSPINIYTRTRRNFISPRERHGFARKIWILSADMTNHSRMKLFSRRRPGKLLLGGNRGKLYFMSLAKFPVHESECLSVPANSVSLCWAYTQRHVNAPATQFAKEWRSYEPSASEFIFRIDFSDTSQRKFIPSLYIKCGRTRKLSKELFWMLLTCFAIRRI